MRQRTSKALRLVCGSVAAVMVLGAVGCSDDNDSTNTTAAPTTAGGSPTTAGTDTTAPGTTQAPDAGQFGGSLTMLTQADTRSFDGAKMNTGTVGHQGQLVYDHLLYFDGNLQQTPGLALSAVVNDAGDQWTLNLRPDVSFTDGTPFNADAVKFHFERVANPETGSPATAAANQIASLEVVDDVTLVVTLKAPDFTWEYALGVIAPGGGLTYVPSPTAVEKFGADYGTSPETTVGAGPFILTAWVPGESSTFAKNENYYDAPKPYLDEIQFRVVGDETTRFNTFTAGEADIVYQVGTGGTMGRLARDYNTGYGPFAGSLAMYFNMSSGPTSDVRIREALAVGADIQKALDLISDGALTWPGYYFGPETALGNDIPLRGYDPDLAAANVAAYLAENGGTEVSILFRGNQAFTDILTALKQDYDNIPGLKVEFQLGPADESVGRQTTRDYENAFVTGFPEDPRSLVPFFRSTSPTNLSYVNDPEIDAALDAATSTVDTATRQQAMETIAERFTELIPVFPINRTLRQWNWTDRVQGVVITGDAVLKTSELWLS